MKLHDLLYCLYDFPKIPKSNVTITGIETDSRRIKLGNLFVCVKGFTVDGHEYAKIAQEKGAVAIVSEYPLEHITIPVIVVKDSRRTLAHLANAFYDYPSSKMVLIGITGTNGKTTTSHLIDGIIRYHEKRTGIIGTTGMKIGDMVIATRHTTPDSLNLQKLLMTMVNKQVEYVTMEVSSHALQLGRVHGCEFDVAVFTNLTQDHLDFHQSMEAYKQTKSLLFSQLGPSINGKPKYAILNRDDETFEAYQRSTQATILSYGIKQEAHVMASNIEMTSSGTSFTLKTPIGTKRVIMKLIGEFNVYNALAAVATTIALGIDLETIVHALKHIKRVDGRFEVVNASQDFTVIVDYAHTPDSLENVLKTIKKFARNKVYCIVGCGGNRDRTKRPLMAQIAVSYSDVCIFTADNPRMESIEAILDEMVKNVDENRYIRIPDRKQAIEYAISQAAYGDVVLIAGKGHETYQIIGNEVFPFDDRLIAMEAINTIIKNR
ncbi:MAG: UDP-N-acetylmuramoyl-L-alanyl-D-glutamate--2,6-diaminopimelate ligase [Bacillaceae bacterium]